MFKTKLLKDKPEERKLMIVRQFMRKDEPAIKKETMIKHSVVVTVEETYGHKEYKRKSKFYNPDYGERRMAAIRQELKDLNIELFLPDTARILDISRADGTSSWSYDGMRTRASSDAGADSDADADADADN